MKKLFLTLFFLSLLISCTDNDKTDDPVYCTQEMQISLIKVQHKDGTPYVLDSVKTFIQTKNGLKDISDYYDKIIFLYYQEQGIYPVTGDGLTRHYPDFIKPTRSDEVKLIGVVEFVGYKDDKELFKRSIKAYTDACHVYCDEKDLAVIYLE